MFLGRGSVWGLIGDLDGRELGCKKGWRPSGRDQGGGGLLAGMWVGVPRPQ